MDIIDFDKVDLAVRKLEAAEAGFDAAVDASNELSWEQRLALAAAAGRLHNQALTLAFAQTY